MGNPGYGGGAPEYIGSKVVRVPLRPDMTPGVEAMIKADPDAGAYCVCNPNNPTRPSRRPKDIEYLLANKPKDAVVVVDEAYIHFSDTAQPCTDVVPRTRTSSCCVPSPRPTEWPASAPAARSGVPICWQGSARSPRAARCPLPEWPAPQRRAYDKRVREDTTRVPGKGVKYIPSEPASFMMMVKGMPGQDVNQAMAKHKVFIRRIWPIFPKKCACRSGRWSRWPNSRSRWKKC